jgi:hypothetical protein
MAWPDVVDLADAALYAVKRGGRNGWLGLMQATAVSAAALHEAAAQPLAEWAAGGDLHLAASGALAAWASPGLHDAAGDEPTRAPQEPARAG